MLRLVVTASPIGLYFARLWYYEELYPLVMEQEELANVGLKNRRHQC